MKRIKQRFTPLGFDHIVFACNDREFWGKRLEWFGFKRVQAAESGNDPFGKDDYDAYWGSAFLLGHVRVFLVDQGTVRFGKTYIEWFLKTRGNMQVVEVGIGVDSIDEAFREFYDRGMSMSVQVAHPACVGDVFGKYYVTEITTPLSWSFRWRLVERENGGESGEKHNASSNLPFSPMLSEGIDHIAIAVRNLEKWIIFYKSLGFTVVYTPRMGEGLIEGTQSAMRTCALQRGGWTIALVEGIDRERKSQVTTYVEMHGDHSAQHAALLFPDVTKVVGALHAKGAQFRLSKIPKEGEEVSFHHLLHTGEDYSGPLLQCFTKPFDRKLAHDSKMRGGFFFELIQRLPQAAKKKKGKQAFHDPTVVGLLESIEREEVAGDSGLVFPEERVS